MDIKHIEICENAFKNLTGHKTMQLHIIGNQSVLVSGLCQHKTASYSDLI